MLVPYSKLKDNIKPLAGLMASDITIEKLYNVVIEYASKVADEYQPGEMWLDGDSAFMRAKANTETMLKEVNSILGINMRQVETRILAGELIFFIEEVAKEYIKEHYFFKRYIVSRREYPETDVTYALPIIAFMTYSQIIFSLSFCQKEINKKSVSNILMGTYSSYDFYRQIGRIATHYRRYISETVNEEGCYDEHTK